MQVPWSDKNAGPGSDNLGPELMSEGKETLLEKKKANGTMLGSNLNFSEREMSCKISGGTFEWTRPPDWPKQIR